jgi:hypothetical protein
VPDGPAVTMTAPAWAGFVTALTTDRLSA